ncbi:MAG: hypothetical protein FWG46_02715 [Treponema sp.]|nr:hypothetical protein [Treponema sp.]
MKNHKPLSLPVLLAAVLFTLVSCDFLSDFNQVSKDLPSLESNQFYAQNMVNGKYYIVTADRLYTGEKCVIWAERGCGATMALAREIADEYDRVIRPTTVEMFSIRNFKIHYKDEEYLINDALDFASWLVEGDGKLTILLLDIQDGYEDPRTDSYVAGYFFNGNFLPEGKIEGTVHYSNDRDMIYIGTNPGLDPDLREQTFATFAHELQHLINYVTSYIVDRDYLMDTWIDEGLSSQAEYFYLKENPADKCWWFSADPNKTIAVGNNFFVWGDRPDSIMDEYATVYLFFRWMYLQANTALKQNFFYNIATSNQSDYLAVTEAAARINPAWSNWETLLRTWFAANYAPKNAVFGYRGDNYLQNGNGKNFPGIKVSPISGSSIALYPGEGVYSVINNSFSASSAGNIRYAGISSSAIDTFSSYTGNVLLTFNANDSIRGRRETGILTGVAPRASDARSAAETQTRQPGPYVLDARDVLGRDRLADLPEAAGKSPALKAKAVK